MADERKVRAKLKDNVGAHFHDGRELGPGETIELPASQVEGGPLSDKFETEGSTKATSYPSKETSTGKK